MKEGREERGRKVTGGKISDGWKDRVKQGKKRKEKDRRKGEGARQRRETGGIPGKSPVV